MSLRGQHLLQAPKYWAPKPLDLVWTELERFLSCHNPSFELSWGTMPKKRGLSKVLSTPNTSFSSGNPHNPILRSPLSFGNFPGSQPVVELHRQSFVLGLVWSFSQTSCLWSWCFSHPSLLDSCKICHLFFEADQPSLCPSCTAWALVLNSGVTLLNWTGRPEHGQDWGEQEAQVVMKNTLRKCFSLSILQLGAG